MGQLGNAGLVLLLERPLIVHRPPTRKNTAIERGGVSPEKVVQASVSR